MIYRKLLSLFMFALLTSASFATECECAHECALNCSTESEQYDVQEEKFIHLKELMFEKIKDKANDFEEIRNSDDQFVEKYIRYSGIMFPLQMSAFKESGLGDSPQDLCKFFFKCGRTEKAKKRDLEIFDYTAEKSFGKVDKNPLSKELVDQISARVTEEFSKPEFTSQLQELLKNGSTDSANCAEFSDFMKVTLRLTLEKHLEILSEFGLDGEEGYLRYTRGLCEHRTLWPCKKSS